jgi:peptide/nickel transport system substrate-binding protein
LADDTGSATEIRAFLIADVRGYTRFTQDQGDEAGARLAARFAVVVREQLAGSGGTVVELRGDEALCVFGSPRAALRAAVDLQRRCVDEIKADPSLPLRVGVGIDAGEAVAVEEGYRGGALNLAARLCSMAGPGEVLVSEGIVHLARRVDGVTYVDRGRVAMKGLDEPVHVVQLGFELHMPADEAKPRRRSARLAVVAMALIAVVGAAIAIAATQLGGHPRPTQLDANVVGILDPTNGAIRGQVPVAGRPAGIAAAASSVWVADEATNQVARIDVHTGRTVDKVPVGVAPDGVAIGGGLVWVADSGDRTVSWIDPNTGQSKQILVGGGPSAIAYGEGAAWVVNTTDGTLQRLDPQTLSASRPLSVGSSLTGVAVGGGAVWVTDAGSNTVVRVDPRTLHVVARQPVGNNPSAVAFGGGEVWVANATDGTITRLDPASGQAHVVGGVGRDPLALSYSGGSVWVADGLGGQVARINVLSQQVSTTPVTGATHSVVVTDGRVWVTVLASPGSHRGEKLLMEMDSPPDSLDPGFSYDDRAWQVLSMTNDGLVGYRRVGGPAGAQVVPDLAVSMPTVSDGGRTYVFQLRRGIRYSNGRLVTASDVRYSIERQFRTPNLTGPEVAFSNLIGAPTCLRLPTTCSLARGIRVDDKLSTVTFHLNHADPNFLPKLATTFGDIVPSGTSAPSPTTRVPATGPYMISQYHPTGPDAHILLARNPRFRQWSADTQPAGYPDSMRWSIGVSPERQLSDVEAGQADVMVDPVPDDRLTDIENRYAALAHPYPRGAVRYLFLNTRQLPFSSLAARRALNYAIDRTRLTDDWGGGPIAAATTCQILPPSIPGYSPYCPYTVNPGPGGLWTAPNPNRAQSLVNASGTHGDPVTLWTGPPPFGSQGASYVKRLLHKLGYQVTVHRVRTIDRYFSLVNNSASRAQIGGVGWVQDYPAPADYLDQLFSCASFHPNSPDNANTSEFCDPVLDKLIHNAEQAAITDPITANRLWALADRRAVDQAAAVPLFNPIGHDVLASDIQNYQHNPEFGLLINQLWTR